MPPSRRDPTQDTPAFGEAVAQWRLAVRTEVKRASSLPTSMFDACDPMLEARLAETAEAMLSCLHEPTADVATPEHPGDRRMEQVNTDELRLLPRLVKSGGAPDLDLDSGLEDEYLGVLADTCCIASGTALTGAAWLLQRDFGIRPSDDLDVLTGAVASCLQGITAEAPVAGDGLGQICRRIAATIALHMREAEDER